MEDLYLKQRILICEKQDHLFKDTILRKTYHIQNLLKNLFEVRFKLLRLFDL